MSRMYTEEDADPIIKGYETHWLICIESYKPKTNRSGIESQSGRWYIYSTGDIKSTEETCIYRRNNEIIVGFRGTSSPKDIYDDMKITTNSYFPRLKDAESLIRSLQTRFPDKVSITLTGHSLGGAIARESSKAFGIEAITFNAASPPTAPAWNGNSETSFHIVFDVISAWQSNTIRIEKGFRPIPSVWERLHWATWINGCIDDIQESHMLKNFSREIPGEIILPEQETDLFNQWLLALPLWLRSIVTMAIFGISGGNLPETNKSK